MAFRIPYRGVVVEMDRAADVREFLELMATPVPRRLPGSRVEVRDETPVVAEGAPRRAGVSRARGGVAKASRRRGRVVPRPRVVDDQALERVLAAILGGVSQPAAILKAARIDRGAGVSIFRKLLADGRVHAEGATVSRRYFPAQGSPRSRAAKEGL